MKSTPEQDGYFAMQKYVRIEILKCAGRIQPPLRLRVVEWDGGSLQMITTSHLIKISTNNNHIDIRVPHGHPKKSHWCAAIQEIIPIAVGALAAKEHGVPL